jgi:hypothetical protein
MQDGVAGIDWNALLQQPDAFGMLIGLGTTAIVILGVTIAIQWRKAQQAKCNAELKARMIERGFTADEIERVINAGAGRRPVGKHRARVIGSCMPGRKEQPRSEPEKDRLSCC